MLTFKFKFNQATVKQSINWLRQFPICSVTVKCQQNKWKIRGYHQKTYITVFTTAGHNKFAKASFYWHGLYVIFGWQICRVYLLWTRSLGCANQIEVSGVPARGSTHIKALWSAYRFSWNHHANHTYLDVTQDMGFLLWKSATLTSSSPASLWRWWLIWLVKTRVVIRAEMRSYIAGA